jgi:hypothetical protein
MPITEPHPARQEPAHHEPAQDAGEPPAAAPSVQRRRHPRRRRVLIALGALLAAAVTVLGVLAGTYQPLGFGDQWGIGFPGLPDGTGVRDVNTFGDQTGQVYVPPQADVFTVMESVYNNGPEPVTIEAVSILSPEKQAYAARGNSPWPVVPAGPVGWMFEVQGLPHAGPVSGRSVAGVTVPPGQGVTLGIPLRLSYGGACYVAGGWVSLDTFYVKERFGPFTHWVTVQFPEPLRMREPESRGALPANARVCLAGPAKPK